MKRLFFTMLQLPARHDRVTIARTVIRFAILSQFVAWPGFGCNRVPPGADAPSVGAGTRLLPVHTIQADSFRDRSLANTYWLPRSAVSPDANGGWYAMVGQHEAALTELEISDETAGSVVIQLKKCPVRLLSLVGTWVQVSASIDASFFVVADGLHRVVAGQRVQPVDRTTNLLRAMADSKVADA